MFCPQCKAEYQTQYTHCATCDVDLVDALPEDPVPTYVDYEEILGTHNPADIALIKSLLDAEGLTFYIHGEHFIYMRPMADPARLMVRRDQAETAREVLSGFDLAYTAINLGTPTQED
jgi:hypothetical protein